MLFRSEVRTLFDQLHEFILTALIEERMRITAPDYQDRMRAIALASAEQSHYQPLEALIQKRIWSAAPVEAAAPTL